MPRLQCLPLTKIDFDNSGWQSVIDQSTEKNCMKYYREFFSLASEAQESGDPVREEVFTLLGAVCSMWLKPDTDEVFQPLFEFPESSARGFVLDDFNDEHIAVLAEVASDTTDPEMCARLADVVWVKGRSKYYNLVEIAVHAYLDSAKRMLTSPEEPFLFADIRLNRALWLAVSIKNQILFDFVLDEVEKLIVLQDENDQEFPFAIILRLLLKYPSRNPEMFSTLSEKLAAMSENQGNWMDSQNYWQIKAEWDIRADNPEDQRQSLIQTAESHVKVGQIYATAKPPNYAAACFQLERAIEIYRSIGGTRSRCEEIHNLILKYQRADVGNFQHVSIPIDGIAEFVQEARYSIKEKPLVEAILGLAFAQHPTSKQTVQTQVKGYLATSIHTIFPMAMVDADGRRIAISPSLLNSSEEEKEWIVKAKMANEATMYQRVVAAAIIKPMVYQMSLDHYLKIDDLAFLVHYNGFVPPDRAYIYLKGLYAGFQGDYLVAAHLLIPQIEHSLRHILNQRGVVTESLDTKTGRQEFFTLDTLLEMPELEDILGADMVFDLQCLLIRRFGSNLRNRLSHGLMHSAEFSSDVMVYSWWLVLHFCCQGLPLAPDNEQEEQNPE